MEKYQVKETFSILKIRLKIFFLLLTSITQFCDWREKSSDKSGYHNLLIEQPPILNNKITTEKRVCSYIRQKKHVLPYRQGKYRF